MGTDTYYFLDRNLGASKPFDESNYNIPPENNQESTWQSIGYYYQFNRTVPSATPDMNVTTSLDSKYGWKNTDVAEGTPWENSICPEGYVIPDHTVFEELIKRTEDTSLDGFFRTLRIGVTGWRTAGSGGFVNSVGSTYSGLWTNYSKTATGFGYYFYIDGKTTTVHYSGRFYGLPVRCVRIVPMETSGNLKPYEPGERW